MEEEEENQLRSVAWRNAQSIRLAQRRAEEALRKQSEWLRVTLASIGDAVISTDAEGRINFMNAVAESLTGWTQNEALGQALDAVFQIVDEQSHERLENPASRVLRQGVVDGLVNHTVLVSRGGLQRAIDDSAAPIRDEQGRLVGCVMVFRDITDRRRAENSLRRNERELADFFENASIGLHWVGPDGVILRVNQAELDLLGYTRDEYVGHHIGEFHVDRSIIDMILTRLTRGETIRECAASLRCKDGSIRSVLINSSALFEDGKFIHTRCFTLDITQRKRAEEKLAEANRRKDEFLATLSHELRNPLAPIRNAVQILKTFGPAEPKLEWCRNLIDQQVGYMSRLMEDLLDVSRITRQQLELRKQRVELNAVVEQAVDIARPLIEARGHKLTIDLPVQRALLDGDLARLTQVFANLLNNAAKYTEGKGEIRLVATLDGEEARTLPDTGEGEEFAATPGEDARESKSQNQKSTMREVTVSIKDTGIGIAPTALPHIFEMFFQAESGKERSHSGLGVGLALAQNLVQLHGGSIAAHSEGLGKGSEFIVRLPLVSVTEGHLRSQAATLQKGAIMDGQSKKIAIVDDNKLQAQSLAMLLEMMGYQVRTAHNGTDAVAMIEEFLPHVALIDIGLPGLSGYELARRLRALPELRSVTLIAQTGWGREEDREQSRQSGFQHHLTKPLDHQLLEKILAEATG